MSPKAQKKKIKAKVAPKKKAAPAKPKAKVLAKAKKPEKSGPAKAAKGTKVEKVKAAVKAKANIKEVEEVESTESAEEEFDPQAFFEASGGKGIFRAHIMRKERVDFNLPVRYRFLDGPLVYNAELLNLSKGGLALRTPKLLKAKTTLRVEIPLPHTSELFTIMAECIWSVENESTTEEKTFLTGFRFHQMSLAKQTVINNFIQQRRDEVVMAKIGLDRFKDSAPVAGID